MPLYNVTAIARAGSPQGEMHGLLSKLSRIVLQRGGVVAPETPLARPGHVAHGPPLRLARST